MSCPDCFKDGKKSTLVFDPKHTGEVCPRCERVFSILSPDPKHFHYATEAACKRRMRRDQRERSMSASTKALTDRILRGD
jgi:hypothetical protein